MDRLEPLVETSAQRLLIAKQVALAKWDSGAPVEDTSREEQVIVAAIKAAEGRGLDPSSVASFFRAQIEANKLVQYSLLSDWRRVGKVPEHTPVDLAKTIRPELDELQTKLIAELVDTSSVRSNSSCGTELANMYRSIRTASDGLKPSLLIGRWLPLALLSQHSLLPT
jgi:chorismate mutase